MAIEFRTAPASGQATITFAIADDGNGPVSVVGSFNDWTPGVHTLTPRADGQRSIEVEVAADVEIHFRYLRSDGRWFDDPDADEITPYGSVIYPIESPSTG
jgi:hypothetical protein